VYVEETSFRAKSIEGVSTTTTGFVGPARYGPTDIEPDILTGLGEFERVYGDRQQLSFGSTVMHNYLWHAVRSFFEEGGKRLYVVRVFRPLAGAYPPANFDAATSMLMGSMMTAMRAQRSAAPRSGCGRVSRARRAISACSSP